MNSTLVAQRRYLGVGTCANSHLVTSPGCRLEKRI
jgi:hypothetical protein